MTGGGGRPLWRRAGPRGAPAVAISVSGPEGRLAMDAVPRVVSLLQSAAAALVAELMAGRDGPGHAPPA